MFQSHNILKQCGELAIVWIKKLFSSLYVSMLFQMVGAVLLSAFLYLFLDDLAHQYIKQQNTDHLFFLSAEKHHLYAGLIALFVFFLISIKIIFNLVNYIKIIEHGIRELPKENKEHSIPIKGNNELACLAKSVNEIKEEIYKKNKKEREAERSQRMLITNISHDLRTPLTSIICYLDLATQKIPLANEEYNYVVSAKNLSYRLRNLIRDLFFYSKIISKDIKMNFVKVNVNTLLYQILELQREKIIFNNLIEDSNKAQTILDIEYFYRIIDNLLDNAIKYSNEDKKITLTTSFVENSVVIEIQNHTDEDLSNKIQNLSERLYRADENKNEQSSGLGLSIVKELSQRMKIDFQLFFENNTVFARLTFSNT